MSPAIEYQSVPTTTQTNGRRRERSVESLLFLIFFGSFTIPFIIFGVHRYNYVNSFNTKPNSCRVNSIVTVLNTQWKLRGDASLVWNVDIVKQSQTNIAAKDLVVLRSSLQIWSTGDYMNSSSALEDAKQMYSVSCCKSYM
jgi:hypothetical protein